MGECEVLQAQRRGAPADASRDHGCQCERGGGPRRGADSRGEKLLQVHALRPLTLLDLCV
eukprot:1264593-Rhodomonas_salina.6